MSLNEAVTAHMNAIPSGTITIKNRGGYVAKFSITYNLKGKSFSKDSGNITEGVNRSITIPAGADEVYLKVEEFWGFGWSTIFTETFNEPVTKCYEVYGTTLDPKYKSVDC